MKRPDTEFLSAMARHVYVLESFAVRASKAIAVLDYISWLEGWREGAQQAMVPVQHVLARQKRKQPARAIRAALPQRERLTTILTET